MKHKEYLFYSKFIKFVDQLIRRLRHLYDSTSFDFIADSSLKNLLVTTSTFRQLLHLVFFSYLSKFNKKFYSIPIRDE